MCPEKGSRAGRGPGAQVSRGAAEGAGVVSSGEKEAQVDPYHSTTT